MAETGTFTFVQTGSVTIGGELFSFTNTETLTSVTNPYNQIITVDSATESVIATIAAENGGATFKDINFVYLENKDTTNTCRVRFKDTGGHTVDFDLDAGRGVVFWNNQVSVSATAGAFSSFSSWDTINAQFDTADGELKVFVCQTAVSA